MRAVFRRWEIPFSFVFLDFTSTWGNSLSGPVHMIPGQLIASEQLTDPRVNFASVHGLTSVTVHMNFSLPRGNFKRWITRCTTPGNQPCQGNFCPCEQNAKLPRDKSSLAHVHSVWNKFPNKYSRKHQKWVNVFKIHSL